MSEVTKRPIVMVVILVALAASLVFAWTRYKAMTGVTKENSVQMTVDELKEAMRRDN
jgi:fumarate reductase subunit C